MNSNSLTPTQEAALECNLGLIEPGKCESCGRHGPRMKFYNYYSDEEIEYDLCIPCMSKAVRCVDIYLRGQERYGTQNDDNT